MLETYRSYVTTPTFPSIESGLLAPYPQAAFIPGHKRNISFDSKNDLCCPQPWRPTSPTAARSRKSKRAVATMELEAEAGQEIQQILFSKTKSKSSVQVSSAADLILTTPKPSSTGPYPFRPTKHNYPPHSPFNEDVASAETQNACDDLSGSDHSDPISLRDSCGLRLVLTQSVSPGLHEQYLGTSSSPILPEVVTPPLRTHNPLTLNSPFSERRFGREGAEIGLLSVSPPPADDEFWARRHKVMSQQAGDFEETLSDRFHRSVHLEQDVIGSAAPEVPSLDGDIYY